MTVEKTSGPNSRPLDKIVRPRTVGWWEEYSCGCISELSAKRKNLAKYCPKQGNSRRRIWREIEWPKRGAANANIP